MAPARLRAAGRQTNKQTWLEYAAAAATVSLAWRVTSIGKQRTIEPVILELARWLGSSKGHRFSRRDIFVDSAVASDGPREH